jgi:hypothetical protein
MGLSGKEQMALKKQERVLWALKNRMFGDIVWMLFWVHKTFCKEDEPLWVLKACKLPTILFFVCFDCLKNCLHYWHLSAFCLLRWLHNPPKKKKKTVVSGLVSKSLVFASFCFGFGLIQINPERYCNVTRSDSIETPLDFIGPPYILLGFLRQTKACFKRMACCVHRGFCILKDHLGVMLLSTKHFCCRIAVLCEKHVA